MECCAPPYIPHGEDCIRYNINRILAPYLTKNILEQKSLSVLGMLKPEQVRDVFYIQMAVEHFIAAWSERSYKFMSTGIDNGQYYYWQSYSLDCIVDRLEKIVGRIALTVAAYAGFYDQRTGAPCPPGELPGIDDEPCPPSSDSYWVLLATGYTGEQGFSVNIGANEDQTQTEHTNPLHLLNLP